MEGDKRQNNELTRLPVGGYSATEDRQADGRSFRSSPRLNAQGQTITLHEAMVDVRPNAITAHIHILEKPRPDRAPCRVHRGNPGRDGKGGSKAIPRGYPPTEEEALARIPRGQRQYLEGRQIP